MPYRPKRPGRRPLTAPLAAMAVARSRWGQLSRGVQVVTTVAGMLCPLRPRAERSLGPGAKIPSSIFLPCAAEGPVAVEKNREILPRAQHAETPIVENDVIEIVHLVGGG